MYTMVGTAKDVVVKDCKGSRVDVGSGSGLLNNNNLLLLVVAIVLICCLCGGNTDFIDSIGSGGRRRRTRGGNRYGLLWLLIPFLFLRGGGSAAPNTNTNIINVDTLGAEEGGLLDL
jgi:hypothetical protein